MFWFYSPIKFKRCSFSIVPCPKTFIYHHHQERPGSWAAPGPASRSRGQAGPWSQSEPNHQYLVSSAEVPQNRGWNVGSQDRCCPKEKNKYIPCSCKYMYLVYEFTSHENDTWWITLDCAHHSYGIIISIRYMNITINLRFNVRWFHNFTGRWAF